MTSGLAEQDPSLPLRVRQRLRVVDETVRRNVETINARIPDDELKQIKNAMAALLREPGAVATRLHKLYRLIDRLNNYNGSNVACRKGCAHCCHVAVAMYEPEARMLGEAVGTEPAKPRRSLNVSAFDYGYHNPCTFLRDNTCSIYEHRPFACRTLVSVDEDALLCELHPGLGHAIPVPYLDRSSFHDLYIRICNNARAVPIADIREYFPKNEP